MKKGSILLLVILCLNLMGCLPKSTPGISYENFSQGGKVVRNIKVNFNKFYPLGASSLSFCGTDTSIYNIDNYDNFFGPIHIEWENAEGKKLTKDLILKKEQLPNFNKRRPGLSSVDFYFTQDDVHLYTSDTPNLEQIEADLYKQAGLTCQEHRDRENKRLWGTTNSDDPIKIYEAIPNDSPLKNDPQFIEEYRKEKAKRAKNNSFKKS